MANMFEDAAEFLAETIASYASEEVLYQHIRGGSVNNHGLVTATPGMSDHDISDFEGVVVRHWSFDWIVQYDDLHSALGSGSTYQWPQRGDSLLWPANSATETIATALNATSGAITSGTWKVFRIEGEPNTAVYELIDPYSKLVRIHTQFIGERTLSASYPWPPQ